MGQTRLRTDAEFMDGQTMGLAAWSWDAWPQIRDRIARRHVNQFGTLVVFADNSRGWIAKGTARLRAR